MSSKSLTVTRAPRRPSRWLNTGLFYLALLLLSLPIIFPFWWMITSSFKNSAEIFAFPPTLLPEVWRWSNFREVFTFQPFARHSFNSLYIAVLVTVGTLFISSMSGYAFARIRFPGSSFIFLMLLSALMMPTESTIIPNFVLMKTLGLTNTHVPLIIIPILGAHGVLGTFMMRQYFLGLPREIEGSAMLDGLGRFGIFLRIALPIARPALGALAILSFLYSWNLFLEPLIYLNDVELFTLPLSLRNYVDPGGQRIWHLQLAATTLSVIPILLVYIFAQRQIIESFTLSGVKG